MMKKSKSTQSQVSVIHLLELVENLHYFAPLKIQLQNIGAYLTSTMGGATPSSGYEETLGITSTSANGVTVAALSNGQVTIV